MKLTELDYQIKFNQLSEQPELLEDIQQALVNEGFLKAKHTEYNDLVHNALVRFKRTHKLTGGNAIGPTTARYLQKALEYGKPSIVSQSQASDVYGSQVYPSELADLNNCLAKFKILELEDIRMFLAQTAHESGGLRWMKELSDGSQYEGREDLGNTQVGFGKKYKGAGPLQLTGYNNYLKLANFLGDMQVLHQGCDYVAKKYPFTSAGFFWFDNGISEKIKQGADIYQISALVNTGSMYSPKSYINGMSDRLYYYNLAKEVIF